MITATLMLTSTLAVSTALTFVTLTTTMSTTNITTPPQNYDEGWDSYNYEEEAHSAAYVPAHKNQSNEPDEDYNTSEGLLCEENTEDSFFSDDLNQ